MEQMTCKDCKYWDRIRNIEEIAPPHPNPEVVSRPYVTQDPTDRPGYRVVGELPSSGFGRCNSPKFETHGYFPFRVGGTLEMTGTEHNDECMFGEGEGRGDGIATGENFGCIHFTPKA